MDGVNPGAFLDRCLHFAKATTPKNGPSLWENLDGTKLLTTEYEWVPKDNTGGADGNGNDDQKTTNHPIRSRVFVGRVQQQRLLATVPSWFDGRQIPCRVPNPDQYIIGTRWYATDMLHLAILQQYDYWIKLDVDIVMREPFLRFRLVDDLARRGAVLGHTATYERGGFQCARGIQKAVHRFLNSTNQVSTVGSNNRNTGAAYTTTTKATTTTTTVSSSSSSSSSSLEPSLPCERVDTDWWPRQLRADADLYYTNLLMGSVRFWQQPLVLEFSRFLKQDPGWWIQRWTDQIFWHYAMGVVFAHTDPSETPNRDGFLGDPYVADYTDLRCMERAGCWRSNEQMLWEARRAPRCNNGGIFEHTKSIPSFTTPDADLLAIDIAPTLNEPYRTTYVYEGRDCGELTKGE